MIPGVVVRVHPRRDLAGNPPGSVAYCWRTEPGARTAWFVFPNGAAFPMGWGDFHRLTAVVGYDEVWAAAFAALPVLELSDADRRRFFNEVFARKWPAEPVRFLRDT